MSPLFRGCWLCPSPRALLCPTPGAPVPARRCLGVPGVNAHGTNAGKTQLSPFPTPPWGCKGLSVGKGGKICLGESQPGDVAVPVTPFSARAGNGIAAAPPCRGTRAAPHPTGPKPCPSHAKPSCSCCAGTAQSQEGRAAGPEGWCRVPRALRPGPLSERARLSPAENMTSAGASARGETFLSSSAARPGLERALGCGREPCDPRALPGERGDGSCCVLTSLQTPG